MKESNQIDIIQIRQPFATPAIATRWVSLWFGNLVSISFKCPSCFVVLHRVEPLPLFCISPWSDFIHLNLFILRRNIDPLHFYKRQIYVLYVISSFFSDYIKISFSHHKSCRCQLPWIYHWCTCKCPHNENNKHKIPLTHANQIDKLKLNFFEPYANCMKFTFTNWITWSAFLAKMLNAKNEKKTNISRGCFGTMFQQNHIRHRFFLCI